MKIRLQRGLPQPPSEGLEESPWGGYLETGACRHGRGKMRRIVGQQPVGVALHGRQQEGNVCRMADEGPCLDHGLGIWEGDEFWPCQGEQSRIILQNLLCVLWREGGSVM